MPFAAQVVRSIEQQPHTANRQDLACSRARWDEVESLARSEVRNGQMRSAKPMSAPGYIRLGN